MVLRVLVPVSKSGRLPGQKLLRRIAGLGPGGSRRVGRLLEGDFLMFVMKALGTTRRTGRFEQHARAGDVRFSGRSSSGTVGQSDGTRGPRGRSGNTKKVAAGPAAAGRANVRFVRVPGTGDLDPVEVSRIGTWSRAGGVAAQRGRATPRWPSGLGRRTPFAPKADADEAARYGARAT